MNIFDQLIDKTATPVQLTSVPVSDLFIRPTFMFDDYVFVDIGNSQTCVMHSTKNLVINKSFQEVYDNCTRACGVYQLAKPIIHNAGYNVRNR